MGLKYLKEMLIESTKMFNNCTLICLLNKVNWEFCIFIRNVILNQRN